MPSPETDNAAPERTFLGTTRRQRFRAYAWTGVLLVVGFLVWVWIYLQPGRWYSYTDHVAFEQSARDVELGHVVWEDAIREAGLPEGEAVGQPSISADGTRMVYSNGKAGGDANLFLRQWDGSQWGRAQALSALNSAFHESAPAVSADGDYLYFASDRPGGLGGDDIWVAKWDGTAYAWPLPLTARVNSPFDETDPAPAPDHSRLYLASDRPYISEADAIRAEAAGAQPLADTEGRAKDFDIYAADLAGDTPFDLIVERQLSMLYSLREGALADSEVMRKLGGTKQTESAVDRGLAYLAKTQEKDGRWDIGRYGGQRGHDPAANAFALLAYYGRGERHDTDCKYRDTVKRGLDWLLSQQDRATGDLRGPRPPSNAMYDHGIASLALIEAYGVTKDPTLRPRAIAAIEFMTSSQHEGGGWRYRPGERGDLSSTGWYIMALGSAKMSGLPVPEKTFEGAKKFLNFVRGGEHGGSYGYTDPPGKRNSNRHGMNAAGFFCSQLLGESPNSAGAWEAAQNLEKVGAKHRDLYYLYYGTLASYQHQGPLWRGWRERMQGDLLKQQDRDGSWNPRGSHSSGMGRIVGTALSLLCLEAHYRYTPLYGLGFEPNRDGPVKGAKPQTELSETPLFRHAKHLAAVNSPADERSPAITDHGDFLYYASAREDGFGGSDIYRSRISPSGLEAASNLGEEINSAGDETDPALRMAGFHLLFNSDRDGVDGALYSANSKRLVKRHSIFKLPGFGWILRNLLWLLLFAVALWFSVRSVRRALDHRQPKPDPEEVTI